jgi:thiol-disulfide isomerase/thioredoxin
MIRSFATATLLALGLLLASMPAAGAAEDDLWFAESDDGQTVVVVYFVYSPTCPHCRAAAPFVDDLEATRPWLEVRRVSVDSNDERLIELTIAAAADAGEDLRFVPTFLFCGQALTGYDEDIATAIVEALDECRAGRLTETPVTTTEAPTAVAVPGVGSVEPSSVPLPLFTVIVAGLDAFNPCAFFVLLFLLSILVHTRSRARMAAIGGLFVAVSGIFYFAFMAAWLNVFLVAGQLAWVTATAGFIAIVLGSLNVKDSFAPGVGPSASIPDTAKPGLFTRMRALTTKERLLPVAIGTVALAAAANSYELLCTAGLPMVYTRVLTMNELTTPAYYAYLVLYNAIYVVPLLAIVGAFVGLLGSRKLTATEGSALKLLSGTMMLGLGGMLLVAPEALSDVGTALAVIGGAVLVTAMIMLARRITGPRTRTSGGRN